MPNPEDYKVYIGDLGNDGSKSELEEAFGYYGRLKNVWVASNPPGFAFVEFEDDRDAEDAVRGLDGQTVCGRKVRVEMAKPRRGRGGGSGGFSRRGGGGGDRGGSGGGSMDCYKCGQQGHMARDCRSNVNGGYRRDGDSGGRGGGGGGRGGGGGSFSCYQCGESGHMARDCRGGGDGGYRRGEGGGSSSGGGGGGGSSSRRGRSPSPARRRRSPSYSRSRSRSPY